MHVWLIFKKYVTLLSRDVVIGHIGKNDYL